MGIVKVQKLQLPKFSVQSDPKSSPQCHSSRALLYFSNLFPRLSQQAQDLLDFHLNMSLVRSTICKAVVFLLSLTASYTYSSPSFSRSSSRASTSMSKNPPSVSLCLTSYDRVISSSNHSCSKDQAVRSSKKAVVVFDSTLVIVETFIFRQDAPENNAGVLVHSLPVHLSPLPTYEHISLSLPSPNSTTKNPKASVFRRESPIASTTAHISGIARHLCCDRCLED